MTDNFKKKILDYLASNYATETGSNIPQFSEIEQKTNNLYTELSTEIGNPSAGGTYIDLLGEIQSNTKDDSGGFLTILYGNSYNSKYGGNNYGWVALIDSNFELIQIITEYSSGTVIGAFSCLSVDESGYLYGIETSYETNNKRFIMLNNVSIKLPTQDEYSLNLRQSYNLPNDIKDYDYKLLRKAPNQAKYLLGGLKHNPKSSYANYMVPVATELTINVGATNGWVTYEANNTFGSDNYTISDMWATWSDDSLNFGIVGSITQNNPPFCFYLKDNDNIDFSSIQIPGEANYDYSSVNFKVLNQFTYYIFAYREDSTNGIRNYVIYKWYDGVFETVYNQNNVYRGIGDPSGIGVRIWGGDIYFYDIQYNGTDYTCHMGRIVDNEAYYITIDNVALYTRAGFQLFMVNKQFNLYNFGFQGQDTIFTSIQIYNYDNYNGIEYQNKESMIPNSSLLYDDNNKIIFARNLYNKVITNNTTASTVQVPNNFINDINIARQDLIGRYNSKLIENNQDIITNIYETLNINFYNTIMMKNENDPNNVIINSIGASRLNNSISNLADYDNAKMGKYRINYSDNTNRIINNIWAPIGNFYRTNINIYVNKEINSIDFISDDENTIYCSISPILEINKIYKIKQDVYIDEKIQPNEVFYGVDEVFYNDEKVYY